MSKERKHWGRMLRLKIDELDATKYGAGKSSIVWRGYNSRLAGGYTKVEAMVWACQEANRLKNEALTKESLENMEHFASEYEEILSLSA